MSKILIAYWPKGGNVERCAFKIKERLGDAKALPVTELTKEYLLETDLLIAGCSTVGAETWKDVSSNNQWNVFFGGELPILLKDKKVALFGLGNQVSYPNHFVDFMGILKKEFDKGGAFVIGNWPIDGYDFESSEAVEGNSFVGLALDEDWQAEMTDNRISQWVEQLKKEM